MSDEVKPSGEPGTEADPIKNLKAEISRKMDNYGESLAKLTETLNSLVVQQPRQQSQQQPEVPSEDIGTLLWKDPVRATQLIEERATKKVTSQLNAEKAQEQKQMAAVQAIYSEYPELSDNSHPATIKAVEIFNKMSKEEQASPMAIKYAAREAAAEFDLKPKSKRTSSTDDSFTLNGGRSGTGRQSQSNSEYDKQVALTASLFGLDVSNDKVKTRLKEKSSRTNWMDYADLKK